MMTKLNDYLEQHWATLAPSRAKETASYMLFGNGKQLRPQLVYAYGSFCGLTSAQCHPIAAAIECIHTYSLIHDDLPAMDNDDWRRGRPTAHRQFDEASAILAGDLLQAFAFQLISTYPDLVTSFSHAATALVAGQSWDIQGTHAIKDIHEAKTGVLFAMCCALPAQLSQRSVDPAYDFGQKIGVWYQMIDDFKDREPNAPSSDDLEKHYTSLMQLAGHPSLIQLIETLHEQYTIH